jgi:hypothetical protein
MQAKMKYCLRTTIAHYICCSYPNCLEKIDDIIFREGYIGALPFFSNSEVAINCDIAERQVATSSGRTIFDRSMDMAFGISDVNSNQSEMVLVELRLNYINPNNLNRKELVEKMNGTTGVLQTSVPIHNQIIFVFESIVKAEARNRLARMDPKVPSSFVVMDLNDLKSTYFV